MCRSYSGRILEFFNVFLVGYHLFWPHVKWPNSDLVVVYDEENELDHRIGTVLASLPPYPKVFYEPRPKEKTFCTDHRGEGYARQQYSNFYSDLYTDKDYVAIVDSDSYFSTFVIPENLFVNGKPRIIGYNACCFGWEAALHEVIGEDYNVGEFMNGIGFPFIVKREHFKPMREHITKQMKAKNFEEAFYKICSKYDNNRYSQFDLIFHYLWFHKRDEYSWHINDWEQSRHSDYKKRMTDREEVLKMNRPILSVMKHINVHKVTNYSFLIIGDYLCVATKNKAGGCKRFFSEKIFEDTYRNLFVDWQFKTFDWKKRGMMKHERINSKFMENPWSTLEVSYNDMYNVYQEQLKKRNIVVTDIYNPNQKC